jgi:GT2 family glycosyltransferase
VKISLVLLSYNRFGETTGPCFESLSQDPDFVRWEVIVVDNGSEDRTRVQLQSLRAAYPVAQFIFNGRNLGFAGGMNSGIRRAEGDIVFLINSDIICPQGMIGRLAAYFETEESLGMIGPVSNAAGNEQAIFTGASGVAGIIEEGLRYADSGGQTAMSAYRLDFCCVAIARKALEKTGRLDEGFGLGYYEDFDYSLRMKDRGFRLLVAEDAFVYHHGSASFSGLPVEARELRRRNRRRIIEKHGRAAVFYHTRQCNLFVLAQYLERKRRGEPVAGYRVVNRLRYALHDRPKNPVKRWLYLRKVHETARQLGVAV